MEISISAEHDAITALISNPHELIVQRRTRSDDTATLDFALIEIATVLTIAKSSFDLAAALVKNRPLSRSKVQKLHMTSPVGAVTVTLPQDVTVEQVQKMLSPLFTPVT